MRGIIRSVVFQNEENGYTIARVSGDTQSFTAVGALPGVRVGQRFEFEGEWTVHPKYGEQFTISAFRELEPESKNDIEQFLASGAIRGVGPKMAQAIVSKFGEGALTIIEEQPRRLLEIEGIGEKKLADICASFKAHKTYAATVLFFSQYGISPAAAMKLYRVFEDRTIEVVKKNPYRMIDEIPGIGFKAADAIAMKMGASPDSRDRIRSGVLYILRRSVADGNTFLSKEILFERAVSLLDVTGEELDDAILDLTLEGRIDTASPGGVEAVFLTTYFLAEKWICGNISRLDKADFGRGEIDRYVHDLESLFAQTEENLGIHLSAEQTDAVRQSIENGVFVVTGGPGTGKTTIVSAIVDVFAHCRVETVIAAPTGRAAKRITEATGHPASTIHRLLEYSYGEDGEEMRFGRTRENPLDCGAVIVDEASMIDVLLMAALTDAIPSGARLVIVGDADQLPPVGAGNVLRDLLACERVAACKLTEIFRQAETSMIVVNAHAINHGEYPILNSEDSDFFMLRRDSEPEILSAIVELCGKRLPSAYGLDPMRDIQVLTPVRKGGLGNAALNRELQRRLNPPADSKPERIHGDRIFRVDDRVMQTRNNYRLKWVSGTDFTEGEGVFNGDMGYISAIDAENNNLSVVYDGLRHVTYDVTNLDELEHAYAVTIHKSQGSEFPAVIIPVFAVPPILATRNLIYTAVTRGKRLVVLVGSEGRLRHMVDNNWSSKRWSALGDFLREHYQLTDSGLGLETTGQDAETGFNFDFEAEFPAEMFDTP